MKEKRNSKNTELKINAEFYSSPEVLMLRSKHNGDKKLIIYMRMFLISRRNFGFITNSKHFRLSEKISILLSEEEFEVEEAIKELKLLGLVYGDENEIEIMSIGSCKRNGSEYRYWRSSVFKRDNFTCVLCLKSDCSLDAHHIERWNENVEKRYDVNNGMTLCEECHKNEHSTRRKK